MHLKSIVRGGALLALLLSLSPNAKAATVETGTFKDRDSVELTIREKDYVIRDRDRDNVEYTLRERDYVFRERDNEYVFLTDSFDRALSAYPNIRDYSSPLTGEQENSQLLEAFSQIELKIKNKTPLSAAEKALIRATQTNRDFVVLTGLLKIKTLPSLAKD